MEQVKISTIQLYVLMVFFQIGSAVVVGLGLQAKQGAWIAILLGMIAGNVFFWMYTRIHLYSPSNNYMDMLQIAFGKILGKAVGFIYIIYFTYLAARVLRDFGELLLSATLVETPLFIILTIMILASFYVISKGIEVLARTSEFYFPILTGLVFFGIALLFASKAVDLKKLQPYFGDGWGVILKTAFPMTMTFPFGELVAFLMLFTYVNNTKKIRQTGYFAILTSGVMLAFTAMMDIAVLGAETAARTTFPLLMTISHIQIGQFIQRLDAIGVFILIIGMFFKVSIFYYVAVSCTANVFNVNKFKRLFYPISLVILFGALTITTNFSEHLEEGLIVVPFFLHLPLQLGVPFLVLVILAIRYRKGSTS
ncbi:GerAB/ArcD/ProY family transporter [Alkalihalobacillus sp. TS-13]|uniref:GerAB/ArcD/ProY family transporter n=1 Tax=Alkalihalobacillus sp. TS-13 TaxID=2842455 RepID=UPI001C878841|nr:GerAB/ArcD/ProY family transporter [Alkalihalobacillus sp. TS-13]